MAAGRSNLSLHGGQQLWDYAAGVLVLSEAGGRACTFQGDDVFLATLTPRSVVAALDGELFEAWREWVHQHF